VDVTGMRTAVLAVLEPYLDTATWPEEQDRLQWTVSSSVPQELHQAATFHPHSTMD
jgi:hypothetical protein